MPGLQDLWKDAVERMVTGKPAEAPLPKKGLGKYGFSEEFAEVLRGMPLQKTGFPQSIARYSLTYQSFTLSIEETYFWIMHHLRTDLNFSEAIKVKDIFTSSEHSSFWGHAQQRMAIQQDRVSQYLATVGKLVKDLFQLVREMRILDERLSYYEDSYKPNKSIAEPAEITLKGYYVDLVEGTKSSASVYGLAQQLGFATLPDLFYGVHPKRAEDVGKVVDKLEFNKKVKEVLKRKLYAYLKWKEETYKELKNRRRFQVKFLRQHYDTIDLYLGWIRPYLRNLQKLRMRSDRMDRAELVSAFETAAVEIETLYTKPIGTHYSCILATFDYVATPKMDYHHKDEYHQKGPIHVGRVNFELRAYAWTKKDIENYIAMRREEDLELLGGVDSSLKEAIDSLGDELRQYLKEAGEKFPEDNKPPAPKRVEPTIFEPFISVFKGFGEMFSLLIPKIEMKKKEGPTSFQMEGDKSKAKGDALTFMHVCYKNYKKAHRMVMW